MTATATRTSGTGVSDLADAGTVVIDTFARRSDRLRLYAFCFFRLAGLVQIVGALALGTAQYSSPRAAVDTAIVRATLTADRLRVSILDHGIGFDPAPTSTDQPLGIGLAQSVRARIEEIGGTVRIDSAPGAGTHVELSLPNTTRAGQSGSITRS